MIIIKISLFENFRNTIPSFSFFNSRWIRLVNVDNGKRKTVDKSDFTVFIYFPLFFNSFVILFSPPEARKEEEWRLFIFTQLSDYEWCTFVAEIFSLQIEINSPYNVSFYINYIINNNCQINNHFVYFLVHPRFIGFVLHKNLHDFIIIY